MKAALCKRLEGPAGLVIEDVSLPVPGPGEALVGVKAAGLNFFDTLITRGRYQAKPELPFSPSAEVAGVVEALGPGVAGVSVGDASWRMSAGAARARRSRSRPRRSCPSLRA
jgi:NADPH2:quinone reductase